MLFATLPCPAISLQGRIPCIPTTSGLSTFGINRDLFCLADGTFPADHRSLIQVPNCGGLKPDL